jgi:glutamate synthase (NADPH/NADH) small chain
VYSEGVAEEWATEVVAFEGDERGRVRAVRGQHVRAVYDEAGTRSFVRTSQEFRLDAELVLLAAGFTGPESAPWLAQCGVAVSGKGRVSVDQHWRTDKDGVWACGDATRGASLVVWAIAQGRACAAAVGAALGDAGGVPAVVTPATQTL